MRYPFSNITEETSFFLYGGIHNPIEMDLGGALFFVGHVHMVSKLGI